MIDLNLLYELRFRGIVQIVSTKKIIVLPIYQYNHRNLWVCSNDTACAGHYAGEFISEHFYQYFSIHLHASVWFKPVLTCRVCVACHYPAVEEY